MSTAFVTGASGFIGVVEGLLLGAEARPARRISRARRDLGYSPVTSIDLGMEELEGT